MECATVDDGREFVIIIIGGGFVGMVVVEINKVGGGKDIDTLIVDAIVAIIDVGIALIEFDLRIGAEPSPIPMFST